MGDDMGGASSQLSLSSTIADALASLDHDGASAAIVFDRGRPVGVVTSVALCGHAGRRPSADAILADVMDFELVALDPASDETRTVEAYTQAAWRSLSRRRPAAEETVGRRAVAFDSALERHDQRGA